MALAVGAFGGGTPAVVVLRCISAASVVQVGVELLGRPRGQGAEASALSH